MVSSMQKLGNVKLFVDLPTVGHYTPALELWMVLPYVRAHFSNRITNLMVAEFLFFLSLLMICILICNYAE